jgi:hypothetical protein
MWGRVHGRTRAGGLGNLLVDFENWRIIHKGFILLHVQRNGILFLDKEVDFGHMLHKR